MPVLVGRLDGMLQRPTGASTLPLDGLCFLHGTGGNFYGSTLFDEIGAHCLERGCAVLRVNTVTRSCPIVRV